jgi:hypothetical protein
MAGMNPAGFRSWGLRNSLTDLSAQSALVPGFTALWGCTQLSPDGLTLYDLSGNGNHGTLGTGAAKPTAGTTGLSFDGGDYVGCGTTADGTAAGLTVMVACSVTAGTNQTLISKLPNLNATGGSGFLLYKEADRNFSLYGYSSAGIRYKATATAAGSAAQWDIITGVISGASLTIYQGATEIGTPAACSGFAPATAQTMTLGKLSYTDSYYLTGSIAAALVYPVGLSQRQIAQNYTYLKSFLSPRGSAPV